jgi:murein DD-endopeptidase MepM/ murein hydrolase activator NlpD
MATRTTKSDPLALVAVFALGVFSGVLVTGIVVSREADGGSESIAAQAMDDCGDARLDRSPTGTDDVGSAVAPAPPPPAAAPARISADPIADLRDRDLLLPVRGVPASALQSSFNDRRGANRRHEAIDILAPRHTPVLAVEDGTIARLHFSEAGGVTVYQYDPNRTYVYYYAHLQRYAPGLRDGDAVTRGATLGYVGTTGNAPEDTPHLHFAIYKLMTPARWWQGTAIDPFAVLR